MDLRLKGRRALVTGSTSGIGQAIARTLGREGARVILHGRSAESVERAQKELAGEGDFEAAFGDLATAEGAEQVVAFLCSQPAAVVTGAAYRADGGIMNTCF